MTSWKYYYRLVAVVAFCCYACRNVEADSGRTDFPVEQPQFVKLITARKMHFNATILSNGKVVSSKKAEIRFPSNEMITDVLVRNGMHVQEGQLLVTLETDNLSRKVVRAKDALEQSLALLDDRLIDFGYRLADSSKVPSEIMKMVKVKSNYNALLFEYNEALIELRKTKIVAPFSGLIADVEARAQNKPDIFKKICMLLDNYHMQAEFYVLESEYKEIEKGTTVMISPFDDPERKYKGRVQTLNPMLDNNGMIKVAAEVINEDGFLLDGMNVKLMISHPVPGQLVLPKSAVVERQGKHVVFTFDKGHAVWNYVETGSQNATDVVVRSGITEGQEVIISNNVTLAHGADVKVSDK